MFGETISHDRRISSPWTGRLSSSASTSASSTAPATPPHHFPSISVPTKPSALPPFDLVIDQYGTLDIDVDNDARSDSSSEADGFFSLDADVSIDQQISETPFEDRLPSQGIRAVPLPCKRQWVQTASPLTGVGRDRVVATRARSSYIAVNGSPSFGPIAPEVDQKGNLEYKLKILPPSRERFDRLVTQLKWRLLEGGGLAVYEIGVLDDGTLIGLDSDSMKDSLKLLSLMAAEVGARCEVQRVLSLEQACNEHELSLRALDEAEATQVLAAHVIPSLPQPFGLYKFNMALQHVAPVTPDVTPSESIPCQPEITLSLSHKDLCAQAQRKQAKCAVNNVRCNGRSKRDILAGKDQAAIVYLPSKEEKRIQRAAAELDSNLDATPPCKAAMDKMVWVADSVQPKTARAKARARKSTLPDDTPGLSSSASSSGSLSASPPAGSNDEFAASLNLGAYSGYENVMAEFGVLSERAARVLSQDSNIEQSRGRLIVEAVVRRDVSSSDNFIDYQGVSSSFKLN